jgi:hypothetical protein
MSIREEIIDAIGNIEDLEPFYDSCALGCGIEDRSITDRYEAAGHGFEQGYQSAIEEVLSLLPDKDKILSIVEREKWVSVEDRLPEQDDIVEIPRTARYELYKPNSQQFKKGIKGRWQVFNGYGWDNLGYDPSRWIPQAKQGEG